MKTLCSYWYVIVLVLNSVGAVIIWPELRSIEAMIVYSVFMLAWVGFGIWMLIGDLSEQRKAGRP